MYISLPFLHDDDVKMPNFEFAENANKQTRNFTSFPKLGYGPLEFNFRRVRLHSPTFDTLGG